MRALIFEDEAPAYRRLTNLLSENHPEIEIIEVIDTVSEAIRWLGNNSSPDLIFSDIQLSDGLSFDIFKNKSLSCPIIFTTAYDEYMLEAFKTNGIDYLLKPIQIKDLDRSIKKFKSLSKNEALQIDLSELLKSVSNPKKKYKERFLVKLGKRLFPIETKEVAYFSHFDGSTELRTFTDKTYIIDQSLDELEDLVDPMLYFRLNRQFLSNITSIKQIHQYFKGRLKVELTPEVRTEVTISREKASAFKSWMDGGRII